MVGENTMLRMGDESLAHYRDFNDRVFGGKLSNKTIFFLAMAMGANQNVPVENFKRSNTGPRTELNDDDFAFASTIQYGTELKCEALLDLMQRNQLAEQLAEGGIRHLDTWLNQVNLGDPRLAFVVLIKDAMESKTN